MDNLYTFKFNQSETFSALCQGLIDPVEYYEVRKELFSLSLMADYDQLVCLPGLTKIDKHWYQIETARKVLRQLGGRALLADEVGLGKTIEAGLICCEYLARGMIQSLLVLTPASLVSQWQSELQEKFNIDTVTTDDTGRLLPPEEFWTSYPRIIASLHTAKSAKHYSHVTQRNWDLVIVDEAHHLKNRTTLNWKLVNALNKRFILMLTATPVQNSLVELFNLLTLLKPGLLKTEAAFKKEYVNSKNGRVPKNPEKLRQLMREVMVRNTRSLVDVKLPKRFATTITVTPSSGEEKLYQDLNQFLRSSGDKLDRLSTTNLLMRAGSSSRALAESLKNLSQRLPDEELKTFTRRAAQIKQVEKAKRLVELLKQCQTKTIVFTTFRATSSYLAESFREAGISFAEFWLSPKLCDKPNLLTTLHVRQKLWQTLFNGGFARVSVEK